MHTQILSVGQQVVFELQGLNLRLSIGSLLVSDAAGGDNRDVSRGFLRDSTAFIFTNAGEEGWELCLFVACGCWTRLPVQQQHLHFY